MEFSRPSDSVITPTSRRFSLDSIRNKIILFAVLATLLPSGLTAFISYTQNRRALESSINREVLSLSVQVAREIDVWLKERFQEMRTLGGSYEVSETLDPGRGASAAAKSRLNEYLRSVRGRLAEYAELLVIDPQGRTVATTTAGDTGPVPLPADWLNILRSDNQLVGESYWDAGSQGPQMVLAVPVSLPNGRLLGGFAARVRLSALQQQIAAFAKDGSARVYVVKPDGSQIVASDSTSAEGMRLRIPEGSLQRLARNEEQIQRFTSPAGHDVMGAWEPVSRYPWAVVAEIPTSEAFREIRRFRTVALAVVLTLLVVVSLTAYRLGVVIVRPLDRLTRGAATVAQGDLSVDLPGGGGGEVGYLTDVFNRMLSALRESRTQLDVRNATLQTQNAELERLSTTDALTGLANRRQLNQRLAEEMSRLRRSKQPLAVLMVDVDHFKSYNDTHGHPAGDEVLKRVAKLLRESIRDVDCAARYGGEEFCALLPETSGEAAAQVAERIRARIAAEEFPSRHITVSIGLAELPKNGDTAEAVVAAADAALYQAKRAGRDRVVKAK